MDNKLNVEVWFLSKQNRRPVKGSLESFNDQNHLDNYIKSMERKGYILDETYPKEKS